jgi:microsomal epoxide hydrolase
MSRSSFLSTTLVLALLSCSLSQQPDLYAQSTGTSERHLQSQFFTTSDDVRLHYLEAGNGPAIVLIPGWTMPAEIWEPQLRGLADEFRVIALDPRSQGASDKATDGHYPERRAQDIYELLQHLQLEHVVLVGWSLGVPEVLTYTQGHGTKALRAVVLVDGFIGADPDPSAPNPLVPSLLAMQRDREGYTKAFVRGMYRKPQPETYLNWIAEASLRTPTNTAFTLLANLMLTEGDWRPNLQRVDRPVLYVVTPSLQSQAEMVRALLPEARVEVFEAGHALFVDEAERFNALLRDFFAGLPPS